MLCFCIVIAVQILLESFPVSSSGHVLLLQKFSFLPLCNGRLFLLCDQLQHLLHGPTIIVLFLFFFFRRKRFSFFQTYSHKKVVSTIWFVGVADCVTTVFYCVLKVFGSDWFPLSFGFLCTALLLFSLFVVEKKRKKVSTVSLQWLPFLLGAAQGIALLPGVSRFGITFVVGRWQGLSSEKSFFYSFLIQWPLLVGAFMKSGLFFLQGNCPEVSSFIFSWQPWIFIVVSSFFAYYGLCFVEWLVRKKVLWVIGFYLMIPFLLSLF